MTTLRSISPSGDQLVYNPLYVFNFDTIYKYTLFNFYSHSHYVSVSGGVSRITRP